jgi:hypothetical protein
MVCSHICYVICLQTNAVHLGGFTRFVELGWNEDWLPLWIQNEGYNAYYSGKLMNGHTVSNYNNPFPKGFAGSVSR